MRHVAPALALLATSCAAPIYMPDVNAMVGKTETQVILAYGRNYRTEPADSPGLIDGKRLVYEYQSVQEMMMYGNPWQFLVRARCSVAFTFSAGVVVYTRVDGNACA